MVFCHSHEGNKLIQSLVFSVGITEQKGPDVQQVLHDHLKAEAP